VDVGRARFNEYLTPDHRTSRPRFLSNVSCVETHKQLKRYVWDEHRRQGDRDLKQMPKARHDDFPTLLKYIMNYNPSYNALKGYGQVYHRQGTRSAVGY